MKEQFQDSGTGTNMLVEVGDFEAHYSDNIYSVSSLSLSNDGSMYPRAFSNVKFGNAERITETTQLGRTIRFLYPMGVLCVHVTNDLYDKCRYHLAKLN